MSKLEELKKQRDEELSKITDKDEMRYQKILWDLKINEAWENERREKYSMTPEQVRAEFLGKKTHIFGVRRKSMSNRIVREDENGNLFVKTDGGKGFVKWNPVVRMLEVTHYEY